MMKARVEEASRFEATMMEEVVTVDQAIMV
jgi:hypothetical protein